MPFSSEAKRLDFIIKENFDLHDKETLDLVVQENNERTQVLSSLTSKLYDKIVDKVDDIDFGTIPKSKGDITKIQNYDQLLESLDIMRNIVKQYGQDSEPVDTVFNAINNLKERKDIFTKSFIVEAGLGIIIYNTISLAIVSAVSFLIATTIEFIKNPADDSFSISFDKVAYNKTSSNLLFSNLRTFNKACIKGEIDKAIAETLSMNKKGLNETAIGTILIGAAVTTFIIGLAALTLPMLQELVYFFYHSKQSVSDYFSIQADLIQMNANNLVYKDIEPAKKAEIIKKQTKIAENFRKISNSFDISYKKIEKETKKAIQDDKKKYTVKEIKSSDNSVEGSVLF
jgi:hypothetical protein